MDFGATTMLASIRRRASIPTTAVNGSTDADLLRLANEELQLGLIADILAVREEYFVRDFNHTIDTAVASYRLPKRAIGGKLRSVRLVDSNGVESDPLPRVEPERAGSYGNTGQTTGYYLKGNNVVLVPSANTTCPTLRLSYFIRPSEIVATGPQGVTIVVGGVFTVPATTGFSTSTACDLVAGTVPHEHLAVDIYPTAVGVTTITFATADIPSVSSLAAAGVLICLAEQTPVAQLPVELVNVLCQRVACTYLEASGQLQELTSAQKKLAEMERKAMTLISPRDDAGERKSICTDFIGGAPSIRYRSGD